MTTQHNLFYDRPDQVHCSTKVIATMDHPNGVAVATQENIVRASGGGEPRDRGRVNNIIIDDVFKKDGLTWLALTGNVGHAGFGDRVFVEIDADYRDRRRRLHTLTHMAIRCAQNKLGEFEVETADIAGDAHTATIRGYAANQVSSVDLSQIDRVLRSEVLATRKVFVSKAKSIDSAKADFGSAFRLSGRHTLSGKIRVVCIEGFDANPCGGLHHPHSNVGPFGMEGLTSAKNELSFRLRLCSAWTYWFGE